MVVPGSRGVSRAPRYSRSVVREGSSRVAYGAVTRCGAPSQALRLLGAMMSLPEAPAWASTTAVQPQTGIGAQATKPARFGLLRVRSPLLTESRLISVPRGTEMFQFPRCPPPLARRSLRINGGGLPHSGSPGSALAGSSPGPFVACDALRRHSSAKASTVCPCSLVLHKVGSTEGILLLLLLRL